MAKEKEKKNKRGPAGVIAGLIGLAAIAAAMFFSNFTGLLGFGKPAVPAFNPTDTEIDKIIVTESSVTEKQNENETEQETQIRYINITVLDNSYIYENKKTELDDIIEIISSSEDECEVHLIQDNPSWNAMEEIQDKLSENKINFIIDEKDNSDE